MQAKKSSNPAWLDATAMLFGICCATIGRYALNRYSLGNVMVFFDLIALVVGIGVVFQVYRENAVRDTYRRSTMTLVFFSQGWLLGALIFVAI